MQKEPRPESHRHLKAFSALDHQAWPLCVCSQSPWRAGHTQLVTPTRARRTRPTAGYLYFHASADLLIWRLRLPDGLTATVALKSSTFFPGRHTCATGVFICLTKAKNTNQLHLGPGPKTVGEEFQAPPNEPMGTPKEPVPVPSSGQLWSYFGSRQVEGLRPSPPR